MAKTTKELIEEYLANGGKIKKCPPGPKPEEEETYKSSSNGPVKLMTLSEGELFYGEKSKRTKKKKELDLSKIDLDQLPKELREKLGI